MSPVPCGVIGRIPFHVKQGAVRCARILIPCPVAENVAVPLVLMEQLSPQGECGFDVSRETRQARDRTSCFESIQLTGLDIGRLNGTARN